MNIAGNITPTSNNVYTIGTPSFRFANIYSAATIYGASIRGNNLNFGDESGANYMRIFASPGNIAISNLTTPIDNGARLQVIASASQDALYVSGSSSFTGSVNITGSVNVNMGGTVSGINNFGLRLYNTDTIVNDGVGKSSPQLQLNGGLWNSGIGQVRMAAGLQVMLYQGNSNPTISKLSFQVGTDNQAPSEKMYVTSNGLFGINGGANFSAGSGSYDNDITLYQTSGSQGRPASSNRIVLKGRAHNSGTGANPTMGFIQMINVVENTNPTIDKLSFFAGPASGLNDGNVIGNATERLALRTDGIFSFFNNNTTETLRLVNNGNLTLQNGGTFTDNGARLQILASGSQNA